MQQKHQSEVANLESKHSTEVTMLNDIIRKAKRWFPMLEAREFATHNHITFMLHNLKKRRNFSVSFNYLIRPSFLRRLINLFQPSERLSAFCFVFSKFQ